MTAAAGAAAVTAAATSNSTTGGSPKQRVGVADYFAILGVGENLIWKHAQHKLTTTSSAVVHDNSDDNDNNDNHETVKEQQQQQDSTLVINESTVSITIPEEDDAMLLERFYREIVHVDIVLAQEQPLPPTTIQQQQQQQQQQGESESVTTTNTTSTVTVLFTSQPPVIHPWSNHSYSHNHHNHPLSQSSSWDTTYTSTTVRSACSTAAAPPSSSTVPMITIPTASMTNTNNKNNNTNNTTDVEFLEGWTVVQKTRPAGQAHGVEPFHSQLWNKGQVWDANLDPIGGITGEIQQLYHIQQQQQQKQKQLDQQHHQKYNNNNNNNNDHHDLSQSSDDRQRRNTSSSLKDLRRRMQSTFQSKTQQWLPGVASTTGSTNLGRDNTGTINNPPRSKFYITYKRRSPEEPNLPAIADIALHYVQIHKSTIILPKSNTTSATTTTTTTTTLSQSGLVVDTTIQDQSVNSTTRMRATSLLEAGKQVVANRLGNLPGSPLFGLENNNNNPTTMQHISGSNNNINNNNNNNHYVIPDGHYFSEQDDDDERHRGPPISLESFLVELPNSSYQWIVPGPFSFLRFPKQNPDYFHNKDGNQSSSTTTTTTTTVLYASCDDHSRQGIEAVDRTPPRHACGTSSYSVPQQQQQQRNISDSWKERLRPRVLDPTDKHLMAAVAASVSASQDLSFATGGGERVISGGGRSQSFDLWGTTDLMDDDGEYLYVPVLAIRRQRTGEEERFLEDPALVDIAVSFKNQSGQPVLPADDIMFVTGDDLDEDDEDDSLATKLLHKTGWKESSLHMVDRGTEHSHQRQLGATCFLVRRNVSMGFCDAAFSTKVLDRFPYKNYKGLPLPEEELPMFCYPTGCRLHRAKYCDAPLPQYYGFVVKNERGDSIYVSCVSFMEPLTRSKKEQLSKLSEKRRRASLPHKKYWARNLQRQQQQQLGRQDITTGEISVASPSDWIPVDGVDETFEDDDENSILTAFDQMTTFENKTICLVSRYPYWTAFRRFLSHLHSISGSSSDLPLERYISHLLLSVPVPKPGGPSILIPLPTFNVPMVLSSPPQKDLPLVDLPFERLVSCLDVPTIVTMVIGFLALERKVIVMSSRPSLVLDVCECARALLFPFELVAPYVPRLTEPFMSCLDFPGAIFVGIHDDGSSTGLAATVRRNMPEDSTIVDLDNGSIDCSGDRMTVLNNSWGLIPSGPRSVLVSEIETLCRDASIVPGQEPLDSQLDSAFEASMPSAMVEDDIQLSNENREPLDDRAIRDAFLRFFCSLMAGYERYLVVPDVDFLISGNEWFDAKGFLASVSEENAPFLGTLVSTQLFQSFIQRRTESSDVHLLLFDECLQEYHSSNVPYGRLGGDVESIFDKETGKSHMLYSLLVDQAATESRSTLKLDRSFDADSRGQGSETDNSSGHHNMNKSLNSDVTDRLLRFSEFGINPSGDWVTLPSKKDIPRGSCFTYCVDGNPTFPDRLNPGLYVPRQPESWLIEMTTASTPMLTRSSVERDEAERRRKFSTSYRGMHNQRKCLWQLPKLMGSHFLGTWLLCIPSLVSQPDLTHEHQSKYLLRALGALRMLRTKQKIVPDEAAYRSLIVACGRTKHDRRSELVKLFGLLRSDGIFPSAVTLGQYTRALAEGYSKRIVGNSDDDTGSITTTDNVVSDGKLGIGRKHTVEGFLTLLDGNLALLEDSGRRWRQKDVGRDEDQHSKQRRRPNGKSWFPVAMSSSFVPSSAIGETQSLENKIKDSVHVFAIWSRTVACDECSYIPLDEEIMGGWDAIYGGEHGVNGAITCPRCGSLLTPKLAFKKMSLSEALCSLAGSNGIPPQITPEIKDHECSTVTYLSPSSLRDGLEQAVDLHGESILEREKLRELYPELLINLWWFCCRFQLPLPLSISAYDGKKPKHCLAVAAWEYEVALRGCYSCAKVLLDMDSSSDSMQSQESSHSLESLGDFPLLSKINLSNYYANVWDHPDLSEILVALVDACDKRDFRPVVESVMRNGKWDCYRTILYLAKYQCTSAFHAFFPATIKPCKGYHFWCPIAPVPIFDHLFREAAKRARASGNAYEVIPEVSDVPLAFRSVFGHLM